jgi:hypothetical protein
MKKIFTFCFVALTTAMMAQTPVAVTFNVDMTGLTVSPNGVHLAGNFNDVNGDGSAENPSYVNWDPAGNLMTMQANGIYTITLNLAPERYEFKFLNGSGWGDVEAVPQACKVAVNGLDNRYWSISGLNPTESMTVCYSSCAACGENTVRFRVDMTQQPGVNPNGVYVAGDFQGWNQAGSELIDPDGNGIYEGYFSLGTATAAQFKFLNGNDFAFVESVPAPCAVGVDSNRELSIVETNTVADVICFSACGPCQAPTPVVFKLDMSLQTVNANGPHVAGSFQSPTAWTPSDPATLMTDLDGDNIYEVTLLLQPGTYQYKFVNGAAWADGNESIPADCNVGGNREVVVAADPVVEHFCYSQCGAECVTDPAAADITFRVNMFTTAPSAAGVWMIGGFTTPVWQAGAVQMTDDNLDGVYECTVNVAGVADIQYKFVNGDVTIPTNEESAGIANCGISNGLGGFNRIHTRTGMAEVLNTVCFDSCADCIIGVQEAMALTVLNAYPVPANEFVTLSFGQLKSAPITVRVMNNLGQVVSTQFLGNLPTGNNQVRVNLEGVAGGIYAIEVSNGIERTAVQIAVQ